MPLKHKNACTVEFAYFITLRGLEKSDNLGK